MHKSEWLAEQFENHRSHLRAVAYRMLGSLAEAEDAVQESWLRLSHSDETAVENLGGWLTTVTARVCLDKLRSRETRSEESLDEVSIPQIKADISNWLDPEEEVVMADSVGRALLVVLENLSPGERLAFVLHDVFGMPFNEIAEIAGRSPVATKKLASRARSRVHGGAAITGKDLVRQRKVAEAFLAASRLGDLNALIELLDPDVVRRADRFALPPAVASEVRGANAVARETVTNSGLAQHGRIALVNGSPGIIVVLRRKLRVVIALTIEDDKIASLDIIADPARLCLVKLAVLERG